MIKNKVFELKLNGEGFWSTTHQEGDTVLFVVSDCIKLGYGFEEVQKINVWMDLSQLFA